MNYKICIYKRLNLLDDIKNAFNEQHPDMDFYKILEKCSAAVVVGHFIDYIRTKKPIYFWSSAYSMVNEMEMKFLKKNYE